MEGIRLKPGQRRKSIARKPKPKARDFDNVVDDMMTFAEISLRPERSLFARKFSQLRYGNYKHQFSTKSETDNASESGDNSRSTFAHSACSRRSRCATAIEHVTSQHNLLSVGQYEPDRVEKSPITKEDDSIIFEPKRSVEFKDAKGLYKYESELIPTNVPYEVGSDIESYLQVSNNKGEDDITHYGKTRHLYDDLSGESSHNTDERAETGDTITDGDDEGQVVELQVEGVRKASIKLPPLRWQFNAGLPDNPKQTRGRQAELNQVSRKQVQTSLNHDDSFSSGDRERTFYRSEAPSSMSSDVSLDFMPSDTDTSDDERSLNISDSDEFDTDLEHEDFGRGIFQNLPFSG